MFRSLFKNAVSVTAEKVVIILMTFITTPILLNELGVTTYGVWILLINMVAWARMTNLGFGSAVNRTAAIYLEKNTLSEMNALFNSSFFLNICLGLVGMLIVFIPVLFPNILGIPEAYINETNLILICLCLKVFADFLLMSVNNFFSASLKENISSNITSIAELLKGLLTVYLVLNGYGIMGMLFALIISDFLILIAKVYYIKKIFPTLRLDVSLISWTQIIDIFNFSKYILLANIALIVRKRIGVNVVSKYVDIASVATFNIAQQLVSHCEDFIAMISSVMSPAASRVLNRTDKSQEQKHVSMIARLNLYSSLIVLMPLVFFSDVFVKLWLGNEHLDVSLLINVFAVSLLTKFILYSAQSVMMAKAKHKNLPIIHITGTLLTIALTFVLAKSHGVLGVVYGLVISSVLIELVFFTPVLLRELGRERKKFLKIFVIVVGVSFLEIYLKHYFDAFFVLASWFTFLLSISVFSATNIFVFWLIIFNRSEKDTHLSLLRLNKK